MSQSAFLKLLDETLAAGVALLGKNFADKHLAYVLSKQSDDGGFAGRRGRSDAYYTDFGVRTLALLGAGDRELSAVAGYIQNLRGAPGDVVECFNRLNAGRILAARGIESRIDNVAIASIIEHQRLPSGGFARKGGKGISAYSTFIAALCHEMLGSDTTRLGEDAAALARLKCDDGGYSDVPGVSFGQTNATAAAVAFLTLTGARDEIDTARTVGFLAGMQMPDGGLPAYCQAPGGDLLSTFSALVALKLLGALDSTDLAAAARFVRDMAASGGGFCACYSDQEPDVEYTYYGIGGLALLRVHATEQGKGNETS